MNSFLAILQYIISPAVIAGVFFWLFKRTFDVGQIVKKIDDTSSNLENFKKESANNLKDFKNDISSDMKNLTSNLTKLTDDVGRLMNHFSIIKTHLVTDNGLDSTLFTSKSPLTLLPKGTALLNKSGFKQAYKKNKKWFLDKLSNFDTNTLAEIDEASIQILEDYQNTTHPLELKELAFNSGISKEVLLKVISIHLRNILGKELGVKPS